MQLPKATFADMAIALRIQTQAEVHALTPLATLAIKIGLEQNTCDQMAAEAQHHADLMYAAHLFFKVACEREAQIRALFSDAAPSPCNDNADPGWWHVLFFWRKGGARGR